MVEWRLRQREVDPVVVNEHLQIFLDIDASVNQTHIVVRRRDKLFVGLKVDVYNLSSICRTVWLALIVFTPEQRRSQK
jgi:hypothetical protein